MRTLEIGIRAGSACNDRDSIRERTRDPPRYLSVWNFLRWESLFLVENKKSYESNVLFRFLPLSFFFSRFRFFSLSFFPFEEKKKFYLFNVFLSIFSYDRLGMDIGLREFSVPVGYYADVFRVDGGKLAREKLVYSRQFAL